MTLKEEYQEKLKLDDLAECYHEETEVELVTEDFMNGDEADNREVELVTCLICEAQLDEFGSVV